MRGKVEILTQNINLKEVLEEGGRKNEESKRMKEIFLDKRLDSHDRLSIAENQTQQIGRMKIRQRS